MSRSKHKGILIIVRMVLVFTYFLGASCALQTPEDELLAQELPETDIPTKEIASPITTNSSVNNPTNTHIPPTVTEVATETPTETIISPTATEVVTETSANTFQINGPLRVNPDNPRYFTDNSGKAIFLTGSHTWSNFQEVGSSNPPPTTDYSTYLDFLDFNNHNFFRLWAWEQSKWAPWTSDQIWFAPSIFQRTGPGNALDGGLKFDLTKLNQAYFDRMRSRIIEAANQGNYVSIMLFDGWSVGKKLTSDPGNPWPGHPFNSSNNINGINGDPNKDGNGYEVHTLSIPAITSLQEAYVRKVIDSVNDLDNVLYEISNESKQGAQETAWQYHMINFIKSYETTKPKQHPVGMTVAYPNGSNSDLFNSPADWISPNEDGGYKDNPPPSSGSKVIILDTDHLWGEGGDRVWLWKSFTRGYNILYMDCYEDLYCEVYPVNDPTRLSMIANLGYALAYADRMNLTKMNPRGDLASTSYCLANPSSLGAEYLVYAPNGGQITINLSSTPGELRVEWLNPGNGRIYQSGTVTGGKSVSLRPPFSGDAVLYLSNRTNAVWLPLIIGNNSNQGFSGSY